MHKELYSVVLLSSIFEVGIEVDTYLVAAVATVGVQVAEIEQVSHRR